jgi:hypothetical protein
MTWRVRRRFGAIPRACGAHGGRVLADEQTKSGRAPIRAQTGALERAARAEPRQRGERAKRSCHGAATFNVDKRSGAWMFALSSGRPVWLDWCWRVGHMADSQLVPSERLESWKAIARYLELDVATVQRWEKTQGLPVRRCSEGRRLHVYAYRSEIDCWLRAPPTEPPTEPRGERPAAARAEPAVPEPQLAPPAVVAPRSPAARRRGRGLLAAALLIVAGAGAAWRLLSPEARASATRVDSVAVEITANAVVARGLDGSERWRYELPRDAEVLVSAERSAALASVISRSGAVLVGTSHHADPAGTDRRSGRLLWLSPEGRVERTFSFEDHLAFGLGTYAAPWVLTDYRLDDRRSGPRVAVAARHYELWPSLVAVLDERFERVGTFVNAGWVDRVQWLAPDRLLIAGFSNAKDGGMVALLDADGLHGQSPTSEKDARFRCPPCGSEAALRYVVLPRSELNRATGAPPNRTGFELHGDAVIARSVETPTRQPSATAVYEFSRSLELLSASYDERYWELHRALEAAGRLQHSRQQCPERNGPRELHVWDKAAGWTRRPLPAAAR